MRILVWQWGRRGGGPRIAAELASALSSLPGATVFLSLSTDAEILTSREAPACALPVATYRGLAGYLLRLLSTPIAMWPLSRRIRALAPDFAICAMPGPLDLLMASALRLARVKTVVTVHDAERHPGDGFPMQMTLQKRLIRRADAVVALTGHVAARLREQGVVRGKPLLLANLPPFLYGDRPVAPLVHGGPMRLLCFGRLLPYKGLDLLEAALAGMADTPSYQVRVVGEGPNSEVLARLAHLPGVQVENRWVPEDEVGALIGWADAVLLPYREASQSGVAALAIAAGRWVVATRVGGLVEQFRQEPRALLCDPEPDSIRQALARLLADPPQTATRRADPRAGWTRMAEQLVGQIAVILAIRQPETAMAAQAPGRAGELQAASERARRIG